MSRRHDDDTPPAEPHVRPHAANLPYIKALGEAIPILSAVLNTLSEVLHELRLLQEPAGAGTLSKIGSMADGLTRTGQIVKRGIRGG
ncbi:MAG TPA: hypothetical protein VE074_13920 [Jatrophihabitantaceae bacterium]|nr:hypothetical protein [Jatrophihabitantaceae bacterium]